MTGVEREFSGLAFRRPSGVRYGSLADIAARSRHIRFTPHSGTFVSTQRDKVAGKGLSPILRCDTLRLLTSDPGILRIEQLICNQQLSWEKLRGIYPPQAIVSGSHPDRGNVQETAQQLTGLA
jgi:hypothetical protein